MDDRGEVTRLLADMSAGVRSADEELLVRVYDELHSLAAHYMSGERPGHTLQATALVHEAYLRLVGGSPVRWESRAHFLRVAARAMRRILIQHARRRLTDRRGGGRARGPLEEAAAVGGEPTVDLLALDEALTRLAAIDARSAQVVELRFFGGQSVEDTARVLGTSATTVKRDWRAAKAWLLKQIAGGG
jgi:RNA polymerase sigma factor (TIGR02999 family)